MNKVSLLKILITIAVLLVSGTVTGLCAQTGSTLRFDDVEGDRVLTAADVKYKHFVTCSHTYDDRSCFVVEDFETGQKKKFYTTPHVEPSMFYTCSGYIVNEMTVDVGRNCWFCGTKWERTGQYVYSLEGLLVPETLYYGYVGRFNLNDVMLGSGNFDIMIVDSSYNLEHFAFLQQKTPQQTVAYTLNIEVFAMHPLLPYKHERTPFQLYNFFSEGPISLQS